MEHFAAAFVWLAVALALLPRVSPDLAIGAYGAPAVIGVTHAFTLGLVLTSIVGALQQLAPAVMAVPATSESLAHVSFGLLMLGTLAIVTGAWWWSPPVLGAGWTAIFLAVALTWWNLVRHLRRATRATDTALAVRAGFASLAAGLAVAFARIGNALGWWAVSPHSLLVAHVHLMVGGFATVIAMGVGAQMLPMFLAAREPPLILARVAWRATAAGAMTVAVGAIAGWRPVHVAGGALMTAGAIAWLGFAWRCIVLRGQREFDRTLLLVVSAHVMLAASCVAGVSQLFVPAPRVQTAYVVLALLGWLNLFISGVAARIIPTLTLAHRRARGATPRGDAATGRPLVPRPLARAAVGALLAGAVALPCAIVVGRPPGVYWAAMVNVAAVVLLLAQHAWLAGAARGRPSRHTTSA